MYLTIGQEKRDDGRRRSEKSIGAGEVGYVLEYLLRKGKIVTLSLGGAGGGVGFTDDTQGQSFADTIWNLFLGGSSSTRPFGSAVLDG